MEGCGVAQTLEVGCGVGRLAPAILQYSEWYIGVDVVKESLIELLANPMLREVAEAVVADAAHLPFCDNSFSLVAMVRVYHRFSDPDKALSEAARVLEPGGRLILLVMPRPSLFTLSRDIWISLSDSRTDQLFTFTRDARVERRQASSLTSVETIETTRARLQLQGFDIIQELGCGLEALPGLRLLPSTFWERVSQLFARPWLSPNIMIVAERAVAPRAGPNVGSSK